MKHYNEPELFEAHYSGTDDAISRHLSECDECSRRREVVLAALDYERLTARRAEQPDTFWTRQRHAIQRRIESNPQVPRRSIPFRRYLFAAAVVAILVMVSVIYQNLDSPVSDPSKPQLRSVETTAPVEFSDEEAKSLSIALFQEPPDYDPWSSDELDDFQSVVEWESWLEEDIDHLGGSS